MIEENLKRLYIDILDGDFNITRQDKTRAGINIQARRSISSNYPRDYNLNIYDELKATCSECRSIFTVYVSRNASRVSRDAFGICEDCEIRNYINRC